MILIAIGSNLSTELGRMPADTCDWAVGRIQSINGLKLQSQSQWYVSAPIPPSPQGSYINGVVRCEGDVDPVWLLRQLHLIEAEAGRVRSLPNAARTLDLDLIDANGAILQQAELILPHPRAHLRAFVLKPVRDVAPEWRHPILGQTAGELLAELPPQQISPLVP
jgi:2-amino-4-hydroxy-6-hydroxymethyldihydropteridine diphosphokinase